MKLKILNRGEDLLQISNMRQIGGEKDDPLKRIQEEINEVARRERELREKMQLQQQQQQSLDDGSPVSNDEASCAAADETHSDDSGISASSSPVNGTSSNTNERKYIRPNSYSVIKPNPPPQKLLTRASSTPQINLPGRRFNISPAQKGIMQRFIASRGKIGAPPSPQPYANGNITSGRDASNPTTPIELTRSPVYIAPVTVTPPIIERDEDGRPIRRGYVPVEEKIQKELRDIKSRETELKRQRKIHSRQSQPDLLDSIEDEDFESDEDSDVEHCFAPGKLRATKSISELCDVNNFSPSTTPSPNLDRKSHFNNHHGLRPALSLAQLCDLDPEEAPSSHDLIAKWENLIQQNA